MSDADDARLPEAPRDEDARDEHAPDEDARETPSDAVRRFTETLDALETRREEVEASFLERVAALDERIDAVARAADQTRERARQRSAERRERLEEQRRRLESLRERLDGASTDSGERPGRPGWPEGGSLLRARINRFVRWLLRDYLQVLDRRADALGRRTAAIEPALRELADLADEMGRSSDAVDDADHAVAHRIVEALAGLASGLELIRHLADAKDAELLERATAGPLRRTDLILDELARQQEALLAEFVDRTRQGGEEGDEWEGEQEAGEEDVGEEVGDDGAD